MPLEIFIFSSPDKPSSAAQDKSSHIILFVDVPRSTIEALLRHRKQMGLGSHALKAGIIRGTFLSSADDVRVQSLTCTHRSDSFCCKIEAGQSSHVSFQASLSLSLLN